MSEDAKKIINTIKSGKLPPLNTPSTQNKPTKEGIQKSERGLGNSTFGLQNINEGLGIVTDSKKNTKK